MFFEFRYIKLINIVCIYKQNTLIIDIHQACKLIVCLVN